MSNFGRNKNSSWHEAACEMKRAGVPLSYIASKFNRSVRAVNRATKGVPSQDHWRSRSLASRRKAKDDLIAEILEALKRLTMEAKLDGMDKRAGWDCWINAAEQAIAKAEG